MRKIRSTDGVRRRPRRLPCLLAAGVLVTGLAVASTAKAANAAGCYTSGGSTSVLVKVSYGEIASGGSTWYKPSDSACKDLNVIYASVSGDYEGWLYSSATGHWSHCAAGAIPISAGSHLPIVLCSNVAATTPMRVSLPTSNNMYTVDVYF